MPDRPLSEAMPELYRGVLDRVASLERIGTRSEALRLRRAATQAYSRAWDETSHNALQALAIRADQVLAGSQPTHAGSLLDRLRITASGL
jgi:hypothetical protein